MIRVWAQQIDPATGEFEIGPLNPSRYRLRLWAPGYPAQDVPGHEVVELRVRDDLEGLFIGDFFPCFSVANHRMKYSMGAVGQFHHGFALWAHGAAGPEVFGIAVHIHNPAVLYLYHGRATDLAELAAAVYFVIRTLYRVGRRKCFGCGFQSGRCQPCADSRCTRF